MTAYSRVTDPHVGGQEPPDLWPIKKVLTVSDVDVDHPCLTLSCQQVEQHILAHHMLPRNSVSVINMNVQDDDAGESHQMKLRRCGTCYRLSGKWGKIIRQKGLKVGMEMRLRCNDGWLHLSVPEVPIIASQPQRPPFVAEVHEPWPIKKALTLSDVDVNHPFLTLSGQLVEEHVLRHWTREARERLLNFNVQDDDTGEFYDMKLKRCGTYFRLVGKWGQVVRKRGLDVGTEIRVRWEGGWLHFSVPNGLIARVMVPPEEAVRCKRIVQGGEEEVAWPIRKVLTLSDVDVNHPFLTLSGHLVREHVLMHWPSEAHENFRVKQAATFGAQDEDTGELYAMKLKWCGTYFKLVGKWGKIIRGKRLAVGREIKIRWHNGCLHFSVS